MSTFADPQAIMQEAYRHLEDARYQAAALGFALARQAARTQGDRAMAFKAGVREVASWMYHGDVRRVREMLLELLIAPPPDAQVY